MTINKALAKIPADSELVNESMRASKQTMKEFISKYHSDISLIKKAKDNFN